MDLCCIHSATGDSNRYLRSEREQEMRIDSGRILPSHGYLNQRFRHHLNVGILKSRYRLAKAFVEDSFPILNSLLSVLGIPEAYPERQYSFYDVE